MAGRRELLKDEAARSVGKTLGFAPLVGLAGLLFGLSLSDHRMAVIVASGVAIVASLIVIAVAIRKPSPKAVVSPQAPPPIPPKDPSTVPAVAAVAPVEPEPIEIGASGGGNGVKAEVVAEPKNGKVASVSYTHLRAHET